MIAVVAGAVFAVAGRRRFPEGDDLAAFPMLPIGPTPDQLLGFPVHLNNDMAVPAANAKSLAFGCLSRYMIRDAMDVTMFRFDDSAYMKLGQVGFLAWARTGGNLMDTNAVKLYQHSAT